MIVFGIGKRMYLACTGKFLILLSTCSWRFVLLDNPKHEEDDRSNAISQHKFDADDDAYRVVVNWKHVTAHFERMCLFAHVTSLAFHFTIFLFHWDARICDIFMCIVNTSCCMHETIIHNTYQFTRHTIRNIRINLVWIDNNKLMKYIDNGRCIFWLLRSCSRGELPWNQLID